MNWLTEVSEGILQHVVSFLFNLFLFCLIGFIASILYCIILWRKGILKRQNRVYNGCVKLYIPFLICVFVYFSLQFAVIYTTNTILKEGTTAVVTEIYDTAVGEIFTSEQQRNAFIRTIQTESVKLNRKEMKLAKQSQNYVAQKNSGVKVIDESKNMFTRYLIKNYKAKLYRLILKGFITASGRSEKTENMTYDEMTVFLSDLQAINPKELDRNVKAELSGFVNKKIATQVAIITGTTSLFFLLFIFIPIIEFKIYSRWLKNSVKR